MNPSPREYARALRVMHNSAWPSEAMNKLEAAQVIAAWNPDNPGTSSTFVTAHARSVKQSKRSARTTAPAAPAPAVATDPDSAAGRQQKLAKIKSEVEAMPFSAGRVKLERNIAETEIALADTARKEKRLLEAARTEPARARFVADVASAGGDNSAFDAEADAAEARATGKTPPAAALFPHLAKLALLTGNEAGVYRQGHLRELGAELNAQSARRTVSIRPTVTATTYPAVWKEYLAITTPRKRSLFWQKNETALRNAQTEMQR